MTQSMRVSFLLCAVTFIVIGLVNSTHGQMGSTINGMVFGPNKTGLSDVDVELLDELSRLIARTRTQGGGRFAFKSLSSGNYIIRVMPSRFGFQEQSQGVELVSFGRGGGAGASNETRYIDFYLQSAKPVSLAESARITNIVFAQEVPNEAAVLFKQAQTDFDNDKPDAGLQKLKKAIGVFPEYFAALDRLGEEFIRRQDLKTAIEYLSKAVVVNSKGASSFYLLGYSQYMTKQYDAAVKSLKEASVWSPQSPNAFLYMGMSLRQLKRFDEAETQMKKAKELAKKRLPEVNYQLALLYVNDLKKYNEAVNELELYLKIQNDDHEKEAIKKLIKQLREKAALSN